MAVVNEDRDQANELDDLRAEIADLNTALAAQSYIIRTLLLNGEDVARHLARQRRLSQDLENVTALRDKLLLRR